MVLPALNHQNSEYVTWQYEDLHFALLGGIRIEGLHSMRVTLKIEYLSHPGIRHATDLYNETQADKLIRKVAERFNLSTSYVHAAIGHLINTIEDYRLQQIDTAAQKAKQTQPILSKEARDEAIHFLQQPELLQSTNHLIGQAGVIGEETNRLIMYLVFTSRKTTRPLHIISFGSSGTGKSHLQERVSQLIPIEDKIELTSVSGNAFYYYGDDDLGHKLVLIEDYDGVLSALYPIRELQSKQKISKTITMRDRNGNTRTLHLSVKGPVSIGGCTTSEHIYEDNANRSFLIYLDESEAQDERIMHYQRKLSAGKIDNTAQQRIQQLLQNTQRLLQPISVRNPYAEQLVIPKEVLKPRRTNAHYIAFIEAVTFYKQYQREHQTDTTTGEVYIETTIEDIAEANELLKDILLKKADELGYATRKYLEQLKNYLQYNDRKTFINNQVRKVLKEHPSKQKRMMLELQQYGYIRKAGGNQKQGYTYEIVNETEYQSLQQSITTSLDNILQNLLPLHGDSGEGVSSSPVDQLTGKPLKTNSSKRNNK